MNRKSLYLVCASFLIATLTTMGQPHSGNTVKPQVSKEGEWIPIFNGKNLDDWTLKVTGYPCGENPHEGYRVENGILKIDYSKFDKFNGRFSHLFYKEKLSSFALHVEYRFVGEMLPDAPSYCYRNSGVMIHSHCLAGGGAAH